MKPPLVTLNNKPLHECYAFELRLIIENRREDGFRCSPARCDAALRELRKRGAEGDQKAVVQLAVLEASS